MNILLHGFVGAFILFTLLWVVQTLRKDAGVVDIGWTAGVGAMAVYAAIVGEGWLPRRILLAAMGGIWAVRLVLYILKDRILCAKEDSRYQRLRAHWGKNANAWFFLFFTSQSLLVVLFTLPFLPGAAKPGGLSLFDGLAVVVWLVAMGGEWLADLQLARFRNHPANQGKVCENGLWHWSRHPNYFFEWLHWFAYVLLAAGEPTFWLALIGPAAMYLFLMKLTGIPHVERESLAKRGEAYRRYQRSTSILIPMPKFSKKKEHGTGCGVKDERKTQIRISCQPFEESHTMARICSDHYGYQCNPNPIFGESKPRKMLCHSLGTITPIRKGVRGKP